MSQDDKKFTFEMIQTVFGPERERRLKRAYDIILNFRLDDETEAASDSVSQAGPPAADHTPRVHTHGDAGV